MKLIILFPVSAKLRVIPVNSSVKYVWIQTVWVIMLNRFETTNAQKSYLVNVHIK